MLAPKTPKSTWRLGTGCPATSSTATLSVCALPTVLPGLVAGVSDSVTAGGRGTLIAAPPPPMRSQACDSLPPPQLAGSIPLVLRICWVSS